MGKKCNRPNSDVIGICQLQRGNNLLSWTKLRIFFFKFKSHPIIDTCKRVIRVSAPFTEDHYCGEGERPNTELAHNSLFASRCRSTELPVILVMSYSL